MKNQLFFSGHTSSIKYAVLLIIMTWSVAAISQEKLEIVGKVKITQMEASDSDSIVVWGSDGTLSMRSASSISEKQILSISNDTIFLSGGDFVKLPAEVDGDVTNEKITGFGIIGDSLYIKEGSMDTMKVSVATKSYVNVLETKLAFMRNVLFDAGLINYVEDIDGNKYDTVKIGNQIWMAENLRTTRYSDGSMITYAESNATWEALTAGGYSFYDTTLTGYSTYSRETFGALYNWYAVDDSRGLCPSGWHVPSDDIDGGDSEWQILVNYLSPDAGLKMKTTSGWNTNNGTNTSGFSGLPGGIRDTIGSFLIVGNYGYWWSSSQNVTDNAWFRGLNYNYGSVYGGSTTKELGLSVRCLRD